MASILCSLQFWTNKEASLVKEQNIGCNFYHEKTETVGNDFDYNEEKKYYFKGRGYSWSLSNRRPEKLKEKLKEFEELTSSWRCLMVQWKTNHIIQAVFANGTIVHLSINISTGDIEKISFDRYLVGKLYSEHVMDVCYLDDVNIIFSYVEPKLTNVQLNKKSSTDNVRKYEKLHALNPKLTHLDLAGPSGRRLTRKLVCNVKHNLLMVWWRLSVDEIWPWTPLSSELEKANILLYNIGGTKFELVSFCRTELEPVMASFSNLHLHQVLTLEQKVFPTGEVTVERCVYEITLTKMERKAIASIPLKSQVVCQEQNFQQDKILIGCSDGTLVMYDDQRKTSQTGKIPACPNFISWHPKGCLIFVSSKNGSIFCFDQALSTVKFLLLAEDFSPHTSLNLMEYFRTPQNKMDSVVANIAWNSNAPFSFETTHVSTLDNAVMVIERGPFILLNLNFGIFTSNSFTPIELIAQYIKHRQLDEAVNFLNNMNWNLNGDACFYVLTRIVNALFRLPLTADREVLIETAIGTFYDPVRPLTKATILQYRDRIRNLARRFFHHLLRFNRLQKASLLAVDIGCVDLFKDLYFLAMQAGDHALAEMSLRNMDGLDSVTSETDTGESQDGDDVENYSESSDSTHEVVGNMTNMASVDTKQPGFKYANCVPTTKIAEFIAAGKLRPMRLSADAFAKAAATSFANLPDQHGRISESQILHQLIFKEPLRGSAATPTILEQKVEKDAEYLMKSRGDGQLAQKTALELASTCEAGQNSSSQRDVYPYGQEKQKDGHSSSSAESEDEHLGTVKVVHFGVV